MWVIHKVGKYTRPNLSPLPPHPLFPEKVVFRTVSTATPATSAPPVSAPFPSNTQSSTCNDHHLTPTTAEHHHTPPAVQIVRRVSLSHQTSLPRRLATAPTVTATSVLGGGLLSATSATDRAPPLYPAVPAVKEHPEMRTRPAPPRPRIATAPPLPLALVDAKVVDSMITCSGGEED
jgi:hypothetical protein